MKGPTIRLAGTYSTDQVTNIPQLFQTDRMGDICDVYYYGDKKNVFSVLGSHFKCIKKKYIFFTQFTGISNVQLIRDFYMQSYALKTPKELNVEILDLSECHDTSKLRITNQKRQNIKLYI